jgi:hypothetical protein
MTFEKIPLYPSSRHLHLADSPLFQERFSDLQPVVSELSFANLFLFRHIHRYLLTTVNDSLVITGCSYDGQPYFLPPLGGDVGGAVRRLLDEGKTLYGADERFVAGHLADSGYSVLPDRDNDDYLYLSRDLADLPGKRFHKKKNRVNYFTARHRYSVEPFCKEHLGPALTLLDEWDRAHGDVINRSMAAETAAAREGLELAEELGLSGVVILTDRGVSAFALGERLNDSTFVCHFEKSDPFLDGVAQLVNREFSQRVSVDYTYINREQDLGVSGLREAKSSYHPVGMIRKFKAGLAGQAECISFRSGS